MVRHLLVIIFDPRLALSSGPFARDKNPRAKTVARSKQLHNHNTLSLTQKVSLFTVRTNMPESKNMQKTANPALKICKTPSSIEKDKKRARPVFSTKLDVGKVSDDDSEDSIAFDDIVVKDTPPKKIFNPFPKTEAEVHANAGTLGMRLLPSFAQPTLSEQARRELDCLLVRQDFTLFADDALVADPGGVGVDDGQSSGHEDTGISVRDIAVETRRRNSEFAKELFSDSFLADLRCTREQEVLYALSLEKFVEP